MDLDTLRFANFSKLEDATSDWEEMVKKLETIAKDARTNLKGKADKANWAGVNAQVSRGFIDKTAGEFDDAHTQASTVHNILKDTFGELKSYHKQLTDAIEGGLKKNLTVMDTGDGGFTVTMNIHPDRAAEGTEVPEHSEQDVNDLRDEVERILKGATDSDNSAAKALTLIVDQVEYGFSDANYGDRDSAANAIKAADEMAELMSKNPHDLTTTELEQLNSYLTKYGKDPLFAEELVTSVGAEKTLAFYAITADPGLAYSQTPEQLALAKKLQQSLGITLGTATLSDSAAMQKWEQDVIDLGDKGVGDNPDDFPRGFQVMSALMRFGDYDDDFLNAYGDKLIAFDKTVNERPTGYWISNFDMVDLNFYGEGDRGRDPMTGFLEALGHNPDASTRFFAQPGNDPGNPMKQDDDALNDHLKYLTRERDWWSDDPQTDHGYMAGQDALGHALESATTGYSYDSQGPHTEDRRNADTAGVMEEVVYVYGTSDDGPKMLHDHPELGDSLGKMAAAYIDDIDHNLSSIEDHRPDDGTFAGRYNGRADFGEQGAINFLSVLGQNKDAHNITSAAQHLYTLSILDANPPTSDANIDNARDALAMEGEARGVLDNSFVEQAAAKYGAESEEAKNDLSSAAGWGKMLAGAVIDTGAVAGSVAIPGGEFVVPLAGGAAKELVNQAIDGAAQDAGPDPTEKSQMTSSEFYRKGADTIGTSYDNYLKDHPGIAQKADEGNWSQDIESAYYGTGSHENDYRGRAPVTD